MVRHALSLPYSFWGVDETIAHLLPADVPVARSFETVGHVAHLNLREEHAPYAALIARVILDKNASSGTGIKTVVRKTGEVGGTFRTYPLEVLGGEDSTETQLIEHGTTLRLDLSDVYWSSRLGTERQRLLALLQPDDVVWDAFVRIYPGSRHEPPPQRGRWRCPPPSAARACWRTTSTRGASSSCNTTPSATALRRGCERGAATHATSCATQPLVQRRCPGVARAGACTYT